MNKLIAPILILSTASLPLISVSQTPTTTSEERPFCPINEDTKLITYDKIVSLPEMKKYELYDKALLWVNLFFKNPTDVLRERNQEVGKIVCKARFKIKNEQDKKGFASDAGVIQFTLTFQFKDGRYRYTISEFNWKQLSYYPIERWFDSSSPSYNPAYAYYLIQVNDYTYDMSASIEKFMVARKKEIKENW
ncbi:MAG: DUF4468 domain-containing protein [Bacteroidia bacterium]|nr:DUF4468 domain-containing protein [Bacteroidia bacterium]